MNTRDMREMNSMDGRNPYGSRGGYVTSRRSRRGRRGDRGMNQDMRMRDYGDMRGRDYAQNQMVGRDMRGDYRGSDMGDMARGYDRAGQDYNYDGHYPQSQGSTYYPIQAMGTFEGYYGMPEQDYAMGGRGRQDYGYDMRGRGRDYGYDMARGGRGGRGRDYGYDYGDYGDDYGDYGETLSEEEMKAWEHKLLGKLNDQEKQAFNKEVIIQKIKHMGLKMEGFSEKELYLNTLANYTDHKKSIGMNPDLSIKLAYDDFCDDDSEYQGAEWLAVYYDTFVKEE